MPTAAATAAISSGVKTRFIGWPIEHAEQDEDRRDEQRDLEARAEGHGHRELHLVLGRELDRDEVLGQVADGRDDDDADEEGRQPERLDERLDGADEDLRQHREERRGREEHDDGDPARVQAGPAWPAGSPCPPSVSCGWVNWKTSDRA